MQQKALSTHSKPNSKQISVKSPAMPISMFRLAWNRMRGVEEQIPAAQAGAFLERGHPSSLSTKGVNKPGEQHTAGVVVNDAGETVLTGATNKRPAGRKQPPPSSTAMTSHRLATFLTAVVFSIFVILWTSGAHHTAKDIWEAIRKSSSPQNTNNVDPDAIKVKLSSDLTNNEGWINTISKIGSPARIAAICRRITVVAEAQMFNTLLLICLTYVLLQTLCIPGTVVLNALIGTLLGVAIGVPLAVAMGTTGACCCFLLSSVAGTRLVESVDKKLLGGSGLPRIRVAVQKYKDELFVYLLFLRLTPVLPNWLVNLSSPVVDIPILPFAAATGFGITPQTYLAVRFGNLVSQLSADGASSTASIVTPMDTALLVLIAVTIVGIHRLKKRFGKDEVAAGGKVE